MGRNVLGDLLQGVTERVGGLLGRRGAPAATGQGLLRLAEELLSGRGQDSRIAAAADLLSAYDRLPEDGKVDWLLLLGRRFGPDPARLERILPQITSRPTAEAAQEMHEAAEPRRQELFRRIHLAPGGTGGLLRLREDVLRHLPAHPELAPVDADFRHLFSSWFSRGFLMLKRIDWSSPASLVEKLIRYEAVHEIEGWDDLRRRVEPADRRCFAFFHPTLPDEPLIFVAVALTPGVPDAIGPLLAENRETIPSGKATTAVFYSISNCQAGLKGVPLGNFLIKQVVEELSRELPSLRTFVTLSPVPGFMRWLSRERQADAPGYLGEGDKAALAALDRPDWHLHADAARTLKSVLVPAVAHYLMVAKTDSGTPIDPVARFHLGNGARLERIHWLSDLTPKGLKQAAGFMVNYLYDPGRIERRQESYAAAGEVAASHAARRCLRADSRGSLAARISSRLASRRRARPR